MVGGAAGDSRRAGRLCRLCHVGGAGQRQLLHRIRISHRCTRHALRPTVPTRPGRSWVTGGHSARAADPSHSPGVPAHLLLLPEGLLSGVLLVAAGLCGAGCPGPVSRRVPVSTSAAERTPILLLLDHPLPAHPPVGWAASVSIPGRIRDGPGHGDPVGQRGAARCVHAVVPLLSPRVRRLPRSVSRSPVRFRLWRFVSRLNARHMPIAWVSLVGVAATDLYVRLVASGTIQDPRFF